MDGWSAKLGAPIFGVTWHFIDEERSLKSVLIVNLKTRTACKYAEKLRCIVDEVLLNRTIIYSDVISIHNVTSDKEAAVALSCDLLTNYVGSVHCIVHRLSLCVNDIFQPGKPWKKYMDHVNKSTSYFNYHSKAMVLLKEK